ncbi:MAG: nucleotide-binding domain containing protein, partial [Chromatiales bacterium]
LLREPGTVAVEVDMDRIDTDRKTLLEETLRAARLAHAQGDTPVVYTSRGERRFDDQTTRLAFGERVSAFLMDVVRGLPETTGYLISKGGITSNDVLSSGLALRASRVVGQILTGCSVVRCPDDHPRYPGLPVVIFPGNVGDEHALAEAYRRLAGDASTPAQQAQA